MFIAQPLLLFCSAKRIQKIGGIDETIGFPGDQASIIAPRIIFRTLNEPCANRIEMNVARSNDKIGVFLHRDTVKTPLHDTTVTIMPVIKESPI